MTRHGNGRGAHPPADWTRGSAGLAYQSCPRCARHWYFHREFCPDCGANKPSSLQSTGKGVVHARTVVYRAPDDDFRALAPYTIVLVDLDDDFRAMGHGAPDLAIGDRVRCEFRTLAGRLLPWFDKEPR